MRFREHRGSVEESMKTLVELKDREALVEHCRSLVESKGFKFDPAKLTVETYYLVLDKRTGWQNTYIVFLKELGVMGFMDSPC